MTDIDDKNADGVSRFLSGMPELKLQGSLRSKRHLGYVLGVNSPKELKGRRVVDGVIRLADKACLEYMASRDTMAKFLEQGYADDLFRAQDHFESCIIALHRAIRFLERLRKMGYKLSDGTPLVPKPREFELLHESAMSKIRRFRDTIEHIEERIINDAIDEKSPASIHIGWQKATLGEDTIEYVDLAMWCNLIYQFALPLSQVVANVSDPK